MLNYRVRTMVESFLYWPRLKQYRI